MKKGLIIIAGAAIVIAVYFLFFSSRDSNKQDVPKQQPLAQSKSSDAFNEPFNEMLNSYFDLKNAFVDWDSLKINTASTALANLSSKVPYTELRADTTIIATAKNFSDNVASEALGVAGEKSIDEKKHSFYTLSENLYNLLRTVQYDQQVIYHDKCPMAFNESEEGFWLSNTREIVNPFYGKKHPHYHAGMLGCGSIEDSLDYRNKQ